MKLFKKPRWLKPEIDETKYYIHLGVIALVVLGTLQYFTGGEMLTLKNILYSIPLLLLGDVVAHTILKLE
jgi:hypothetical protein